MRTSQEVFNIVANHLLDQNKRSDRGPVDECLYRGPNGLMCAVGVLIPDEQYHPDMEGCDAVSVLNGYPDLEVFLGNSTGLLHELQQCHDSGLVTDWINILARIGDDFELTLPERLTK